MEISDGSRGSPFYVFVLRDLLYDHGVLDSVRTERVIIENSIESIGRIGYN